MLTRLSIRNIVLIEALDLDFGRGLGESAGTASVAVLVALARSAAHTSVV